MVFTVRILAMIALCAACFATASHAAEQDQKSSKEQQAQAILEAENPNLKKLNDKTRDLAEKLGEAELKNLFFIRETFGALRAVSVVKRDIGAAVKACGKANPDMKDAMNERFSAWEAKVDPVMNDRQKLLDHSIDKQSYLKPKEIRDYLGLIQKTADHADKKIDKNVITTAEACESLRKSMDKTEDVVAELLEELEIPPYNPLDADKPKLPMSESND